MKRIVLAAVLLAFALPAFAQEPDPEPSISYDVCLKMTGNRAQARAAIRVLGLGKEMLRDVAEPGDPPNVVIYADTNHVFIHIWETPILKFGTYGVDENGDSIEITPPVTADAPYLFLRFRSEWVQAMARVFIIDAGGLPAGLEKVDCPTTRGWAGG